MMRLHAHGGILSAVVLSATILLSACGAGTRNTPGPSSTLSSSAPASTTASSGTAGTSVTSDQTGAQYAQYYRVNGTATIAAGSPLAMNASDFAFKPNTLTVKAGTPVHINVDNTAAEPHNFDLPIFGANVNLPAGTTTAVTFTPTKAGTYYFWCNLPGHAQAHMVGKLTVTP